MSGEKNLDVTARGNRGRVNIRTHKIRKTSRLRFTGLHEDQVGIILLALERARGEAGTQFDSVALTSICQNYLST